MHQKVAELFKNAGFSRAVSTRDFGTLFGGGRNQPDQSDRASEQQIDSPASDSTGAQNPAYATYNSTQTNEPSGSPQTTSSDVTASAVGGAASDLFGAANLFEGLLGGGLLGDLLSGIAGLFGGGQAEPPAPVQYVAPQSRDFELATGGGQTGDAVYNQFGSPQVAPTTEPALSGLESLGAPSGQSSSAASSGTNSSSQSSPQVTVNVQAMDSQSFMDRSQEIAQAVRQAMLNMHSINDVINDL